MIAGLTPEEFLLRTLLYICHALKARLAEMKDHAWQSSSLNFHCVSKRAPANNPASP